MRHTNYVFPDVNAGIASKIYEGISTDLVAECQKKGFSCGEISSILNLVGADPETELNGMKEIPSDGWGSEASYQLYKAVIEREEKKIDEDLATLRESSLGNIVRSQQAVYGDAIKCVIGEEGFERLRRFRRLGLCGSVAGRNLYVF